MNKKLYLLLMGLIMAQCISKKKIIGMYRYNDKFLSAELKLNMDSTFFFQTQTDVGTGVYLSSGKWHMQGRCIVLESSDTLHSHSIIKVQENHNIFTDTVRIVFDYDNPQNLSYDIFFIKVINKVTLNNNGEAKFKLQKIDSIIFDKRTGYKILNPRATNIHISITTRPLYKYFDIKNKYYYRRGKLIRINDYCTNLFLTKLK